MLALKAKQPTDQSGKKIHLTGDYYALVDDDMFEELNRYKWSSHITHGNCYAVRKTYINLKPVFIYMHRVVAKTPPDMVCHHIYGNSLDNRRAHLQNLARGEHDFIHWI